MPFKPLFLPHIERFLALRQHTVAFSKRKAQEKTGGGKIIVLKRSKKMGGSPITCSPYSCPPTSNREFLWQNTVNGIYIFTPLSL